MPPWRFPSADVSTGEEKLAKKRAAEQKLADKKPKTKKWRVRRRKDKGVRAVVSCEVCPPWIRSVCHQTCKGLSYSARSDMTGEKQQKRQRIEAAEKKAQRTPAKQKSASEQQRGLSGALTVGREIVVGVSPYVRPEGLHSEPRAKKRKTRKSGASASDFKLRTPEVKKSSTLTGFLSSL